MIHSGFSFDLCASTSTLLLRYSTFSQIAIRLPHTDSRPSERHCNYLPALSLANGSRSSHIALLHAQTCSTAFTAHLYPHLHFYYSHHGRPRPNLRRLRARRWQDVSWRKL